MVLFVRGRCHGHEISSSFKHSSIGAKTHEARTATAHMSYIMRAEARTHFQAENMPDGGRGTRVFFDKLWEKAGMPENARICDKLMLALPGELTPEQRYEAVHTFMQDLGQGRIVWCAAYHEKGEDAHNPHAHIVLKDADIDTRRKVIGTTTSLKDVREAQEHGWKVPPRATSQDLRNRWCDHLNKVMERAGLDIRYDARSFREQGIDREPQIPIGPKAQALEEKGHAFDSHDQTRGDRTIAYSLLDQASRVQYNDRIHRDQPGKGTRRRRQGPRAVQAAFASTQGMAGPSEGAGGDAQGRLRRAEARSRSAQNGARGGQARYKTWAKQLYASGRQAAYDGSRKSSPRNGKTSGPYAAWRAESRRRSAQSQTDESLRRGGQTRGRSRRPENAAWKALKAGHEKERFALQAEHRKEYASSCPAAGSRTSCPRGNMPAGA